MVQETPAKEENTKCLSLEGENRCIAVFMKNTHEYRESQVSCVEYVQPQSFFRVLQSTFFLSVEFKVDVRLSVSLAGLAAGDCHVVYKAWQKASWSLRR